MPRRVIIAGWVLELSLLSAQAGCSWAGLRHQFQDGTATPAQAAQTQQISEHIQDAIDRREYEAARIELVQLLNQAPDSVEARQRLGTVLLLEGRLPEAEACFRAALSRDRDYVDALIGLGQTEAHRGDTASALKRFETAIEIDPHRYESHFWLGRLLEATGKTDEALAAYFRTLEFESESPRRESPDRGDPARAESTGSSTLSPRSSRGARRREWRGARASRPRSAHAAAVSASDRRLPGRRQPPSQPTGYLLSPGFGTRGRPQARRSDARDRTSASDCAGLCRRTPTVATSGARARPGRQAQDKLRDARGRTVAQRGSRGSCALKCALCTVRRVARVDPSVLTHGPFRRPRYWRACRGDRSGPRPGLPA